MANINRSESVIFYNFDMKVFEGVLLVSVCEKCSTEDFLCFVQVIEVL